MFSLKTAAFSAATILLMSGSMAVAQRPGQGKDDRFTNQPPAKVEVKTAAAINNNELASMLQSLGYQFKTVTRQNGYVVHELDVPSNGKMVFVDVSLSKDGTKLWFTALMTKLPSGQQIPAPIMQKLLEANLKNGPNFFAIGTDQSIFMQCPLDNRGVTAEDLRREIDIFVQMTNQTEPLWNANKWGTVGR